MQNTLEKPSIKEVIQPQHEIGARLDFYKLTMSQFVFETEPETEVTFRFNNRTDVPLARYVDVDELRARLEDLRQAGFSEQELDYLAGLSNDQGERRFSDVYLDFLRHIDLVEVTVDKTEDGDLKIETTGPWAAATLWETIVLSEVNELRNRTVAQAEKLTESELYTEGLERLQRKIDIIKDYNAGLPPDSEPIRIVDFGTRRHFSPEWHSMVVDSLRTQLGSDCLVGTSNIELAERYDLKPVGTFAHELPMVYAALNSTTDRQLRASQKLLLRRWFYRYPDLSVALSDTFGNDAFFDDFSKLGRMSDWIGLRHDSGDPFEFAERAIEFYEKRAVDPTTKLIVFSDGLEVEQIVELHRRFRGRIKLAFGWGTNLTNDLGIPAVSIVMKAVEANGIETVKLSEVAAKATGQEKDIERFSRVFGSHVREMMIQIPKY